MTSAARFRRTASPKSVLVAPDKFKGTLTATQAAKAITQGLRAVWPGARFTNLPIADGGEGFAEAFGFSKKQWKKILTQDARGRPVEAAYGLFAGRRTAFFNLAAASGLAQLPEDLRDPRQTSTYGSGLVLRHLAQLGVKAVFIGLGGSATNDGGIGLAAAMGYRFLDRKGKPVPLNGQGLLTLVRIEPPLSLPCWRLIAAADVDSPLHGPQGAARRFAPQKGADPKQVRMLDQGLRRLSEVSRQCLGRSHAFHPGAGAAGGSGFGLMTFLGAELKSGFEIIREYRQLDRIVRRHDLIVTGEGCLDDTTLTGKAPGGLAAIARAEGKAICGVFGRIELGSPGKVFAHTAAVEEVCGDSPVGPTLAMHQARVKAAAERLARTLGLRRRLVRTQRKAKTITERMSALRE